MTDFLPKKLAALRAHASQTEHMTDLETMIRGWMAASARARRARGGSARRDVPRGEDGLTAPTPRCRRAWAPYARPKALPPPDRRIAGSAIQWPLWPRGRIGGIRTSA